MILSFLIFLQKTIYKGIKEENIRNIGLTMNKTMQLRNEHKFTLLREKIW